MEKISFSTCNREMKLSTMDLDLESRRPDLLFLNHHQLANALQSHVFRRKIEKKLRIYRDVNFTDNIEIEDSVKKSKVSQSEVSGLVIDIVVEFDRNCKDS